MPLLVQEARTPDALTCLAEDPQVVTWAWTRVEIAGAVERRSREGELSRTERRDLLERLDRMAARWEDVVDLVAVRTQAISLLARHALRAADAAQLGAALLACEHEPRTLPFVCFDDRLAEAAEREGFVIA